MRCLYTATTDSATSIKKVMNGFIAKTCEAKVKSAFRKFLINDDRKEKDEYRILYAKEEKTCEEINDELKKAAIKPLQWRPTQGAKHIFRILGEEGRPFFVRQPKILLSALIDAGAPNCTVLSCKLTTRTRLETRGPTRAVPRSIRILVGPEKRILLKLVEEFERTEMMDVGSQVAVPRGLHLKREEGEGLLEALRTKQLSEDDEEMNPMPPMGVFNEASQRFSMTNDYACALIRDELSSFITRTRKEARARDQRNRAFLPSPISNPFGEGEGMALDGANPFAMVTEETPTPSSPPPTDPLPAPAPSPPAPAPSPPAPAPPPPSSGSTATPPPQTAQPGASA